METETKRLLDALELYDDGVQITRQRLARMFPTDSEEERGARLNRWLRREPHAE